MRIEYNTLIKRNIGEGDILVLKDMDAISWEGNYRMICKRGGMFTLVCLDTNNVILKEYASIKEIMSDTDIKMCLVDVIRKENATLLINQDNKLIKE